MIAVFCWFIGLLCGKLWTRLIDFAFNICQGSLKALIEFEDTLKYCTGKSVKNG